jgi:hypothetical protein
MLRFVGLVMLTAPLTELPYKPTIDSLLAGIDTEYKDDIFKKGLLLLNPNDQADRKNIIKNYIIKHQEYLSYRHKFLLIKELEKALANRSFDFAASFEYDYEVDEPSASPWLSSEIHTPRTFFEDIFTIANDVWGAEISMAATEDQSTW